MIKNISPFMLPLFYVTALLFPNIVYGFFSYLLITNEFLSEFYYLLIYFLICNAGLILEILNFKIKKTINHRAFDKGMLSAFSVIMALNVSLVENYKDYQFCQLPYSVCYFLGLGFILLGLVLRYWSARSIKDWFLSPTNILQKSVIVQNGPYKYIRHPAYLGTLLMLFGNALAFKSLMGIFCLMAAIVMVLKQIEKEEKKMLHAYEDDYKAYQKITGELLPLMKKCAD